ncbi:hypothetical protein SDC9_117006 [bioreactor metagenome]|uniref:Cytosolic protein n=1 Tax=bioreactor metagenome TaxID=1076179 RepID=A0A645BXS6_9ZZZZ
MEQIENKAWALMVDGYDLHIHTAPSAFPRALDSWELVNEASQAGMAGVMLKSHYESTAIRAELINRYSNCTAKAYGGIALNWPVGGLNVYAVENALKVGAKIVWMPTRDSANSLEFGNMDGDFFEREGIYILTPDEKLKPCIYDIMDTVKKYDATLATGHLSPKESILLCREGCKRGVRMILTHPEFPRTKIPAHIQKELADDGVLIEKNWFNVAQGAVSIQQMTQTILDVGTGRTFIATDRGQGGEPRPVPELHRFICELLKQGLNDAQIRDMVCFVPKSIVG